MNLIRNEKKTITTIAIIILSLILILGLLDYLYIKKYIDLPFETKIVDSFNSKLKKLTKIATTYESEKGIKALINTPDFLDEQDCSFTIRGSIQGNWFYKGKFNVDLTNDKNERVKTFTATTNRNWMQDILIPFYVSINCDGECPLNANIVFNKSSSDNEDSDKITIPVYFSGECENQIERVINLYWGNMNEDPFLEKCEETYPFARTVSINENPYEDTLNLLFAGPISKEISNGVYTSIPVVTTLKSISIENGVANIDISNFDKKNIDTKCKLKMIRSQIENTLLQFPEIKSVIITVDGAVEKFD